MLNDEFGTVDFNTKGGGSRAVFPKRWKLKSPEKDQSEFVLELRVMPPMKSLKSDPRGYGYFQAVHFGYNGVNEKNPDQPRYRPFACIRKMNYKTKEVLVECPACLEIESRKQDKEDLLRRAKEENMPSAKLKQLLDPINDWLSSHNKDNKFKLNAMSVDGEFGVLSLTSTCFKEELIPLFQKTAKEVHPLAPSEGIWVRFTRTGFGREVIDKAEAVMESVLLDNGKTAKTTKLAPLTEEQLKRSLEICPDLKSGVVDFLTQDQIKKIVNASSPEEIDKIWDGTGSSTSTDSDISKVSSDDFFANLQDEYSVR